jgi:hypothetical protein
MSGERPWWLPTAVFVAPVGVAIAFLAPLLAAVGRAPVLMIALLFVAGFVTPIVDLARRERRARREGKLPSPSRAALKHVWRPLRGWPITSGVTLVVVGAGMLLFWPWAWAAGGIDSVSEAFAPLTGLIATWTGWAQIRSVTRSVA